MLDTTDKSKYSGKFFIDGKDIDGELTFDGSSTSLLLHHPEFFRADGIEDYCAHGILRDLTHVSLFQCVAPEVSGNSWKQEIGSYSSATIRPSFVLHGGRHLSPSDKLIKSISVILKDGPILFPDYDAFSTTFDTTPRQLRSLLKAKQTLTKRRIKVGKYPQIAYFTGRHQIFRAKTVLGTVAAHHAPSFASSGPRGVSIANKIVTRIAFPKPMLFADALESLRSVLLFLEIVVGRRQELESVHVGLKGKSKVLSDLQVYWCSPPRRERSESRSPHLIDLPINAALDPTVFANILGKWLERHETWKGARSRFSESFAMENTFSPDRLIGSANMFDLLPASAVPRSVTLSDGLKEARNASKELFEALPLSIERDSVLAALGRLGRPSLKRKVRHRATFVINALGPKLPNLMEVLDLAVDARNHFVHGTESKIDYVRNFFETVAFFSKALEFVFVVSDLLDAGWDINSSRKNGTTGAHPLPSFLIGYGFYLRQLREVLPEGHKLKAAN